METVVCRNPKTYNLTVGKEYDVVAEDGSTITIFNDRGLRANYNTALFEEVSRQLTDQEILDSYEVTETEVKIKDREDNFVTLNTQIDDDGDGDWINVDGSIISCGVKQISGINSLAGHISEIVEEFGLENTEAVLPLKRKMFADYIKVFINRHVRGNAAFVLFSTNNDYGDIVNALDDYSSCTDSARNPNSNNDISVWIINVVDLDR